MKSVAGTLKLVYSQYRELQSFAQFGSDLDANTKATLAQGERIVEVLKQHNSSPVEVIHQVAILYAVTKGFLKEVPVEKISEYEAFLYETLDARYAGLLAAILREAAFHVGFYRAGCEPLSARIAIGGVSVDPVLLCQAAEALSAAKPLPREAAELAAAARCFGAAGCKLAVVELPDAGLASALPNMPVCAVTAIGPDGEDRAGQHRLVVEKDRAEAAVGRLTAPLDAQTAVAAHEVNEQSVGGHVGGKLFIVQCKCYLHGVLLSLPDDRRRVSSARRPDGGGIRRRREDCFRS